MRGEEFNKVVEETLTYARELLIKKNGAYNTSADRLQSFKTASSVLDTTPIKALGGMMSKHTISIYDLIGAEEVAPLDIWIEKISDHINYLVLLKALVVESQASAIEEAEILDPYTPHNHPTD